MVNNKMVYNEIKGLVIEGPGWAFIKQYDASENGREAILALKAQAEGQSAVLMCKQCAYVIIRDTKYFGHHHNFAFANYVQHYQEAYNELASKEINEEVPESRKVHEFLAGIQDPRLEIGKAMVLGNPMYMNSFHQVQQFLSTLTKNKHLLNVSEQHNASGLQGCRGHGQGRGGGCGGGRGSRAGQGGHGGG